MPGTTRYSATFDRPYEEEDRPASDPFNGSRRSRSQSWANIGADARPYTPLGNNRPPPRSSSTDSGASNGTENIPTRSVSKTVVKTHNNPFQFVKVGSCPLYKKAEEQLKKTKEVKKPEVLKEEEEEWQTNLDSWKSRRRKMSEDVFRRQEEIRQFEQEEQFSQAIPKKTKTFSEMVESRANRGRALSLCLISSPFESQEWEDNKKHNSSHPFSEGSAENSAFNSEDEGVGDKRSFRNNIWSSDTNGNEGHSIKNGSTNGCKNKVNETSYTDSGLESISSSHRMGDTPDSCSDFSQDSGSSIDCDSPRVSGLLMNSVNLLEDFKNSKSRSENDYAFLNVKTTESKISKKDELEVIDTSGSNKNLDCFKDDSQNVPKTKTNSTDAVILNDAKISESSMELGALKSSSNDENPIDKVEHSVESENEVFVDDFEELNAKSKIFTPSSPKAPCTKTDPRLLKSTSISSDSSDEGVPIVNGIKSEKSNKPLKSSNSREPGRNGINFEKLSKSLKSLAASSVPTRKKSPIVNEINFEKLSKSLKSSTISSAASGQKSSTVNSINTENSNKSQNSASASSCSEEKSHAVNGTNSKKLDKSLKSASEEKSPAVNKVKVEKSVESFCCSTTGSDGNSLIVNEINSEKSSSNKTADLIFELSYKKLKNKHEFPGKNVPVSENSASVNEVKKKQESHSQANKTKEDVNEKKQKSKIEVTGKNVSESESSTSVTEVKEKQEPHSQVSEIKEDLNEKKQKNTIRRKKKKATAKIVSLEISDEKANPSANQKEAPSATTPRINEDSLNIVFQSQPLNRKDFQSNSSTNVINTEKVVTLSDVTPVEKIAEEMEKLILQQLEEEERAKEMSSKIPTTDLFESPENNLIAPPKVAEPPKEKPPPPPVAENETPKTVPLKRVNSTKRIKKEIHKRRSNFLGIENADENVACDESIVPPPPALEQILKVEVELEKESRKRLESAADERLKLEESEIIEKEQEIIANLETEERQRHLFNNTELCDMMQEEDRILKLKEERKKMENDRILAETQRLRIEEGKQLREREKILRIQEADNSPSAEISTSVLSDSENLSNNPKSPYASSLCLDTKPNVSLSGNGGEGKIISDSTSQPLDTKNNETKEKPSLSAKPEVPPKPLKKKEAIRKERERLRQEQEALQREREEHRQKLLKEQEELLKNHPKPHAPNVPVSRLGPIPPVKPAYKPQTQLTNYIGPQPSTRENVIFTSQNFQGAQNGISSTNGCVEPVLNKQNKVSSHKKVVQNELWVQQKVSPIRKQPHESSPESKYNQNHWLIQEAEMRRIAELKERQHSTQYPIPQTHLAEDDVCSTSPRAPVISPTMSMNAPMQDKLWSYGHSNMPQKKYPPPITSEKPVGLYPPQPPAKPSRVVPIERPEHMLSVSGRKRCSHCSEELGRGAAMIIESLQLYYHIHCFQCCVCQAQLGNGSCGTDVRVRNNKLHCHNCYSNDEAGLKFSQV
ncbi:LIM and calponin homology domains-containing protein 1 [Nephila pilipes]|uniref:LIM and calponin homology domains-containing protein 1 n=1 Tax=Nephila pilipes TaxID=299642 RepID=A0A8X6R3U2_NEPPI|nr:LIM and calponin homology domains-containing protein 1 [Nephila pilipes]